MFHQVLARRLITARPRLYIAYNPVVGEFAENATINVLRRTLRWSDTWECRALQQNAREGARTTDLDVIWKTDFDFKSKKKKTLSRR